MIRPLIDRYLSELQHKNPATVSHLKYIAKFFDGYAEITPASIMDYVLGRRKDEAKPSTINRELTILKQFFRWAVVMGHFDKDPSKDIRFEKGTSRRVRYITPDEETSLIAHSPTWLQPIIQFAAATGMRRGEILALRVKDVNMEGKIVTVRTSKNGEPRIIPLSARAMDAIDKAVSDSDKVFGGKGGGRIILSTLEYDFKAAAKRAGISDLHFHDLRHTFCSRLVQAGVDLYAVQLLAGHKNPAMTQRYAHHNIGSLKRAITLPD